MRSKFCTLQGISCKFACKSVCLQVTSLKSQFKIRKSQVSNHEQLFAVFKIKAASRKPQDPSHKLKVTSYKLQLKVMSYRLQAKSDKSQVTSPNPKYQVTRTSQKSPDTRRHSQFASLKSQVESQNSQSAICNSQFASL